MRHIAVEGVIGVGKTSLAKMLARDMGARLNLEVVEENPFLARFYDDPRRYAFSTQVFFLLSRYNQQQQFFQQDLFQRAVVSDYIFAKDRIFANVNLDDEELRLYERVASELERRVPVPDLVVYLQAGVDVLMTRIHRRGRTYERSIARDYIETLNEAYNHFFFHYAESPLLVVNTNEMDFVHQDEHYRILRRHIEEPFQGVQYYTPSWER
ncbi:MAG: deoxynucleoside kinase [Candidatus Latescibacterota bacterium]|nr:MAG: deoxynucleoside kinase [Candidatus Latescibacterota bacterium]